VFGFVATAALALAFVTIEQAVEHPMLDVRLFTDRRFSAASASVTVTFFSLSGFIFLITQYFQVLRGFSPFSTGARILPVAGSIAVGSVVGGLLAPRIGTRTVVVSGLVSFGTAMAWIAGSIDTNTPYWATIVSQMLLMGLGIGLISTPATESIMLVLPPARAGIGSAVNDATREFGLDIGRRHRRLAVSHRSSVPTSPTARSRRPGEPVRPPTRCRSRSGSPPTAPRSSPPHNIHSSPASRRPAR